jgi:multisubunit Na+/H+ antiporter MnhG subunit
MTDALVHVLLFAGVAAELICCIGIVAMRTTSDRLHYAGAGYTVGPLFVVAALVVQEGFTSIGLDALALAFIVFLPGPILVHATARVVHRAEAEGHKLPEQHL